ALAEGHNTHQHRTFSSSPHERSAAVALAGVDAALPIAGAYHPRQDLAIVGGKLVAGGVLDVRHTRLEQVVGGVSALRCGAPARHLKRLSRLEAGVRPGKGNHLPGGCRLQLEQRNVVVMRVRIVGLMDNDSLNLSPYPFGHVVRRSRLDLDGAW